MTLYSHDALCWYERAVTLSTPRTACKTVRAAFSEIRGRADDSDRRGPRTRTVPAQAGNPGGQYGAFGLKYSSRNTSNRSQRSEGEHATACRRRSGDAG